MNSQAVVLGSLGLALALGGGATPRRASRPGTDLEAASRVRAGSSCLRRPEPARVAAAALGVAVVLLVGGVAGVVAGILTSVGADRALGTLEPIAVRRRRERRATELPLVLDLLSICLQSGMPLVAAQETVAEALPGQFGDDLRVVAGLQRLGSSPAAAWTDFGEDPDLAPVARAVSRSAESGSRLAAAFERLAADRRSELATAGLARARHAGVVAMAPLGLCFLPAFVSLGIVPIVLSLAEAVLP